MKRDDYIRILDDYYKKIGRKIPPQYRKYTLSELRACMRLFQLPIE